MLYYTLFHKEWIIYVDQSKASLDKGSSATLDALVSLVPPSRVQVVPCILPKNSKKKAPWIRCISVSTTGTTKTKKTSTSFNLDIGGVDSVDKCYRVLTKHLQVQNVNVQMAECLKYKYRGNNLLESSNNNVNAAANRAAAIDAYLKALACCSPKSSTNNSNKNNQQLQQQQGVILLLKSSAYLQQAHYHKALLQKAVNDDWKLPRTDMLQAMIQDAEALSGSSRSSSSTAAVSASFLKILADNGIRQKAHLRSKVQYRHGLYQTSLLQAAQDALHATELLPTYSTAFLRAGEVLNELWRIKESKQYYDKALELLLLLQQEQQQGRGRRRETDMERDEIDSSFSAAAAAANHKDNSNQDAITEAAATTSKSAVATLEQVFRTLETRQALLDRALSNPKWSTDSVRLALDVAVE